VLAPRLPLPIPVPLATGTPGCGYPFRWSVRRWLDGEPATLGRIGSMPEFAAAVARFVVALQAVDAVGGPTAGEHSFYRGASLTYYDDQTRQSVALLRDTIDAYRALEVWDAALDATWQARPVWVHGDVATGNLLVRDGQLAAVIDFGTCAVGDPACDLVIAWTFLTRNSRAVFHEIVGQDDGTWARARGWALWKALISLAGSDGDPATDAHNRFVIAEVLADTS
jgi:aminoglycoside phosphotransferase (APT) family kinase protein